MMDDKHLSEFPSSMNVCKSSGTSLHLEESKDKNSREQTYSTTESDRFVSEDMIDSDSDDESSVLPPPPDTEAEVDESRVPLSDMDKDENISYSFHEIIVATESLESESKSVLSHASGACTGLSDGRPNYCNQDIANASREADRKTNINEDKHKTRTNIDQRLTHALDNIASSSINRSPDLVPLTRNYHTLRKQLRALIASIKSYKKSMEQTDAARSKLFREYSLMSNNTPLFNHVAVSIDAEQMELIEEKISLELLSEKSAQLELTSQASIVCIKDDEGVSLAFVQQLAHAFAKRNSQEYENFILDYASEWHDIVTAMLDSEIDLVRQLQRRRFHYERKVGALRRRTNTIESRGKDVPAALGEKLLRNEQKLSHAWENHEQRATRLCALLEEVTENGWKDLYPLIQNTMKFEWNRVSRDMTSFGRLKILLNELNNHFAQPQPLGT